MSFKDGEFSHFPISFTITVSNIIIRNIQHGDGLLLARLSEGTPVSPDAPPLAPGSCERLIATFREEQKIPTVVKDGKVISGPKTIDLVIAQQCSGSRHHGGYVIGTCGFTRIDDEIIDGNAVRVGDLQLSLDPKFAYRLDIAKAVIRWLFIFAFNPASVGALQIDWVKFTLKKDDVAMECLIKDWLRLPFEEADNESKAGKVRSFRASRVAVARSSWEVSKEQWLQIAARPNY